MQALLESLAPGEPDHLLVSNLDPERLPDHIAVIMDGNGRWARRRNLPRVAGHRAGVESVRETMETCARLGIPVLTLYAFSVENWKRPRAEVDTLWHLLRHFLDAELDTLQRNNIRFDTIGRTGGLPTAVRHDLDAVREATASNTGTQLNLALNYGGRTELVDAVNSLLEEARAQGTLAGLAVTEEALARHLYTGTLPDPDLLIRTSGEMRVSNFLLWQIAYAELYVTDVLWPDFRRGDLLRAVAAFQQRDRRFGAVTAAPPTASSWLAALGISSR